MAIQVGYGGLKILLPGDILLYQSGRGDYRIEARVTVAMEPGSAGVFVHIDEITNAGIEVEHQVGDVIVAGAEELYREDDESREYMRKHLLAHCRKAGYTDDLIAEKLRHIPDDDPDKAFLITQFIESLSDEDRERYSFLQEA